MKPEQTLHLSAVCELTVTVYYQEGRRVKKLLH
jgi:hypothetical protein